MKYLAAFLYSQLNVKEIFVDISDLKKEGLMIYNKMIKKTSTKTFGKNINFMFIITNY